jgi:peptidoglycan/xylan/chitin deacetylase (PgdA/CDA1 family)
MVLTYHEILPKPSRYAYAVGYSTFREHLSFLADLRAHDQTPPGITFDDGHVSHYAYGMPILEEYRFQGIFFVTAGWIASRPSYMNWTQLAELSARGHEVQSHSWSHRLLTGCSQDELSRELSQSKDVLEQRLGKKVDAISVPGGRWNRRVAAACVSAGYRRVYTSDPWLKPLEKCGALHIGRYMVRRTTGLPDIRTLLDTQDRPFHSMRLQHTFKQALKTVVGDRVYQRAWELLSAKSALPQSPTNRAL